VSLEVPGAELLAVLPELVGCIWRGMPEMPLFKRLWNTDGQPIGLRHCKERPTVVGGRMRSMNLNLEVEQEADGRWMAEVLELPGVMAYGASADEAMVKAEALALRALAEQLEHGEVSPLPITLSVPAAA
jgi:predicted RNase H-like HicB family nuclease